MLCREEKRHHVVALCTFLNTQAVISVKTRHPQVSVVQSQVAFALRREMHLKSVSIRTFRLNSQAYEKTMLFSVSQ